MSALKHWRFAWGSLLMLSLVASPAPASERPNIIVIVADDMGYGDLACYGAPTTSTPRLDRMAEEGIRLTDFYVGASVCSASRACLLTGRIALRHNVGGAFFPGRGSMSPNEIPLRRC
jgi:arylsulfatase A-like enzyme